MQIDPGVAEAREARKLLDNGVRMSACDDVDAIRIQRVVRDHQLAIDPFVPGLVKTREIRRGGSPIIEAVSVRSSQG